MIEIIDRKKGKKEWGYVYEYNPEKGIYIQCDRFRTNFGNWKKARKGSLIHIRRENFHKVYSLL